MASDSLALTIVVPARNEADRIASTLADIQAACEQAGLVDYEVCVVDDGSTDNTRAVAEACASADSRIQVLSHPRNVGMGAAFMTASRAARGRSVTLVPADGLIPRATLAALYRHQGRADWVGSLALNTEVRSRLRRNLSRAHSFLYAGVFDLPVTYIHALPMISRDRLLSLNLSSRRYGLFAEVAVKLLRQGATFMEIPGYHRTSAHRSQALRLRSLVDVLGSFSRLALEVFITERARYSHRPRRIYPDGQKTLE